MTEEEIEKHKKNIDALTQTEMCILVRFARAGHPYFQVGPVNDYFQKRFKERGGFTPAISKAIGWRRRKDG